jgi:hypothetical protein
MVLAGACIGAPVVAPWYTRPKKRTQIVVYFGHQTRQKHNGRRTADIKQYSGCHATGNGDDGKKRLAKAAIAQTHTFTDS